MSEPDVLPADVADLVAAVAEALEIPMPSVDGADERKHYRLLENRTTDLLIALRSLLRHREHPDLAYDAAYIRRCTAHYPVTYTPFVRSRTEETA
ncbi:hypothetical protein ACFRFJ_41685 [Streptomyces hydrogenans]|uniref:hypothetical protein n=1 Tax=Streptomyces hydrogenans TaxID=1873719 RepID=UPI0036C30334